MAVALACILGTVMTPASAVGAPTSLSVTFGPDARAGEPTAVHAQLQLPGLPVASLTSLRLGLPPGFGIATSGLGLDSCRLPASAFERVVIGGVGLVGCPRNSVLGYGSILADVNVAGETIGAAARITVLAGELKKSHLDVVAFVDGTNPFGVKLAYRGTLQSGRAGEELFIRFPPITVIDGIPTDATVALRLVRISIGSHEIIYSDGGRRYHPEGVRLPARCPPSGARFTARLGFADATAMTVTTTTACPRATPRTAPAQMRRMTTSR